MSFKKILTQLTLALSMASLIGCSEFISGQKKNTEVIEFSAARFVCLREVPQAMKHYTTGESSEQKINQTIDCLQNAFSYFRERTKGSFENGYSAEDLRKFFGKYFLKENNISSQLAADIMKLKQAVIGGSEKSLTKDEIIEFNSFLNIVRDEAIALRPYIKILFLQEQEKLSLEDIQNATNQLKKSLLAVLYKTKISKSEYTFADTKKLMSGLADFISGTEKFTIYVNLHHWIPLADSVKVILMGPRANFNGTIDWSDGMQTVVSLYDLLLKYQYLIKDIDLKSSIELRMATKFAQQSLDLALNSYQLRHEGRIPFSQIDHLIDLLYEQNIIDFAISPATIKDTYRRIVLNMLDPVRKGDSRGLNAVEATHLLALQREFNVWKLNQVFVDSLKFDEKGLTKLEKIRYSTNEFQAERIIPYLTDDDIEREALRNSWADFKSLFFKKMPIHFNQQGRVNLVYSPLLSDYHWQTVTRLNVMHTLTRGLMLGYGDGNSMNLRRSVISEWKLSKWYSDFNLLGVEIKAFDPRSSNSGPRSFKEANFFTMSGNGDERMDFDESFELISFMVSGGLSSSEVVRKEMISAGCALKDVDVFGLPMLKESCFKQTLRLKISTLFNNMPGLLKSVTNMKSSQWDKFYAELLGAARTSPAGGGYIETADLRTMVMLLHYTESLMVNFDLDQSGGLNQKELKAASTRFLSFLAPLSPIKYESFLTDVFVYLVYKGHRPDATDYAYFQGEKFAEWVGVDNLGEAKRIQILSVLRNLKDELKNTKKQAVISQ